VRCHGTTIRTGNHHPCHMWATLPLLMGTL
jgi:hypothetical protein